MSWIVWEGHYLSIVENSLTFSGRRSPKGKDMPSSPIVSPWARAFYAGLVDNLLTI